MAIPSVEDLEVIHLKSTEKLIRALEDGLNSKGCQIRLSSVDDESLHLRIVSVHGEHLFQLVPGESSAPTYFCVSDVQGKIGKFVGPVVQRLRTIADDESFKHAREGLVKDVEEHRQQILKTRMYHVESASALKIERSETGKRALKKGTKHTQAEVKSTTVPLAKVTQSKKKKKQSVDKITATASAVHLNQSAARVSVSLNKPIKRTIAPLENTAVEDVKSGHSSLHDRCISAVARRRGLEARLAAALANSDRAERETLIEEIRVDLYAFVDELLRDSELKQLSVTPIK